MQALRLDNTEQALMYYNLITCLIFEASLDVLIALLKTLATFLLPDLYNFVDMALTLNSGDV